jgi:hypothetical protein
MKEIAAAFAKVQKNYAPESVKKQVSATKEPAAASTANKCRLANRKRSSG